MSPHVPMLDLGAEHGPMRDELNESITRVIDSGHWTTQRQDNAQKYRELLGGCRDFKAPLAAWQNAGVKRPHIYNQFVVRSTVRDALREFLKEKDISTEIYYPVPLHKLDCFSNLSCARMELPAVEAAARETLALPIAPNLSEGQIETVGHSILEFLQHGKSCASVALQDGQPNFRS